MPTQTQIHFESDLKTVDWKLIARIQDERKQAADLKRALQSKGAYHSLYLQAQKEIKKLKQQLNNGKSIDINP